VDQSPGLYGTLPVILCAEETSKPRTTIANETELMARELMASPHGEAFVE